MRILTLTLALLGLTLSGCTFDLPIPSASDDDSACDDDTSGDDDTAADDDTGDDDSAEPDDTFDLTLVFTAPGAVDVGSMWCHLELVDDLDQAIIGGFGGWELSSMVHWGHEVTIACHPGVIDAVRANCTFCPDELAEEPFGTEAEELGCGWMAYGMTEAEAHLNGALSTTYFSDSYSADTITFEGEGSSVLVDLR